MKRFTFLLALLVLGTAPVRAQFNLNRLKEKALEAVGSKPAGSGSTSSPTNDDSPSPAEGRRAQAALPGKLVLTNAPYQSYAEAAPHAIQEVKDGDPLYLYVKLPLPVQKLVRKVSDGGDGYMYCISVYIGADEPGTETGDVVREYYAGSTFTKKTKEAFAKYGDELAFNLAPFKADDPRGLTFFVDGVGGRKPGVWQNAVWVEGSRTGEYTDLPEMLAYVPLRCNVPDGLPKYKAMHEAATKVSEKGTAATNELRAKGAFADAAVRAKVLAAIKASGLVPNKLYFAEDQWQVLYEDHTHQPFRRSVQALFTYKKDGQYFSGRVSYSQTYNVYVAKYGAPELSMITGFPIKSTLY